jgi:meiotic recombination protein SPO11
MKRGRDTSGGAEGGAVDRDSPAADAGAVLAKVRALVTASRARAAATGRPPTLAELGITGVREVIEMPADGVLTGLESLLCSAASSALAGDGFSFAVPSRAASNTEYIAALDRNVLRAAVSDREFTSVGSVRKVAVMTRVLQLLYDVVRKGIHVTKRDLFYTDVKLFVDQKESDVVLEDVAATLGATRTSLHVVASDKGIVVGRVRFRDDGDLIDCTRMGVGGKVRARRERDALSAASGGRVARGRARDSNHLTSR